MLPCRGGEPFLRRLFEPLGYAVEARRLPLDSNFPEWGKSPYYRVRLAGTCRLRDLLSHLYVLLPVLDDDKHYWVGQEELDKLLARGEGWLSSHPEREQIARRYLKHQRYLAKRGARPARRRGGSGQAMATNRRMSRRRRVSSARSV